MQLVVNEAINRLRLALTQAAEHMAASLPELLDRVQEWQTDSEAVLKLISGRGWLVSRRMMPRFTSEMLALYRAGGMEAVEAELLAIYDDDFCIRLVAGLRSDLFIPWRPVLKKAIAAHARGDYELAIPIWLITAEGVIAEWQKDPGVYKRLGPTSMRGWLSRALGTKGVLHTLLVESLVDVLAGQRTDWKKGKAPTVLNRHGVLHGQLPAMGDAKDSVQGMLVLEALDWLIPCPTKATSS